MSVPRRARAGLEAHQAGAYTRRRRRLDDRLLPDDAGEALGRPAARRPGATRMNVLGPELLITTLIGIGGWSAAGKIVEILARYSGKSARQQAHHGPRSFHAGAVISQIRRAG